eukprot:2164831-Amphidinium_carterae.2
MQHDDKATLRGSQIMSNEAGLTCLGQNFNATCGKFHSNMCSEKRLPQAMSTYDYIVLGGVLQTGRCPGL